MNCDDLDPLLLSVFSSVTTFIIVCAAILVQISFLYARKHIQTNINVLPNTPTTDDP